MMYLVESVEEWPTQSIGRSVALGELVERFCTVLIPCCDYRNLHFVYVLVAASKNINFFFNGKNYSEFTQTINK